MGHAHRPVAEGGERCGGEVRSYESGVKGYMRLRSEYDAWAAGGSDLDGSGADIVVETGVV